MRSDRLERRDVSVYILRRQDGHYLSRHGLWTLSQRRAMRFPSKKAAVVINKKRKATIVRLIVRMSEEEG